MRNVLRHQLSDIMPGETGLGGGAAASPAQTQATPPAANSFALTAEQVQQMAGPIMQQVSAAVGAAIGPIREAQTALQNELNALRQPQRSASQLYGAAGQSAAVQTGEAANSSRGYQYWRALAFRQGAIPADQAKVEIQLHNRLHQHYVQQGGMTLEGANSVLVPLGADLVSGVDEALATEVRQMLGAGFGSGVDLARVRQLASLVSQANGQSLTVRQAASQFDETGMAGFLGATTYAPGIIELMRAREVFSQAGATNLALPPNGRLRFNKQTGATQAYWIGEVPSNKTGPTITASEPTTGFVTMIAKKIACLMKLPNELIRFATPELEAFYRMDMATVMALAVDLASLEGAADSLRIKGVLNYSGIQTRVAATVGSNGNTLAPEDVGNMLTDLEEANHDTEDPSCCLVMRPKMYRNIMNRKTSTGAFVFEANRSDGSLALPTTIEGRRVVRSTQVSGTRAKGSSSALTYVLAGVFRNWLIGRVGVMEFATSTQGDTAFTTDQTWVRAIQHIDAAPRYENAFVVCDSIDPTLS